ncbi:hypothetical protein [Xanthobacter autotrophicus]|uniref:hypothetical protein n=1 Tax=Xanthobacter autotrophicus TaxID=280 RepID=UPI0024A69B54|nr:hypothetical protein [Xanthobacter autotrophicus]MDI4657370.1 hypothetical protein [Xanthobacter autotrophicus]
MTKLLDQAIAEIRKLSDAEQDRAAELLLGLVHRDEAGGGEGGEADYQLTPEQVARIEDTMRRIEDGTMTFVSEEEMGAVWARFGL